MANIYETNTLNKPGREIYYPSEDYDKHDVVKVVETYVRQGGTDKAGPTTTYTVADYHKHVQKKYHYYYARNNLTANNHGSDFQSPTISSDYWGGVELRNGELVPSFFWTPSYGSSVNHKPFVQHVKFGEGYSQRIADSINSNLLQINLTFDKRRKKETAAILHFLHARKGVETFLFSPPEPYNTQIKAHFVCPDWQSNFTFFDNYNISATFIEVAG